MRKFLSHIEESFIALLLATMVLVTFSQVVARYVFNSGAIWALELTTYLFAWLVLFGISYGIKKHIHIGVDAFAKLFSSPVQRFFGILSVLASMIYAGLMLYGSWVYFAIKFKRGTETDDLPIPEWVFLSVLLISMAMIIMRLIPVLWDLLSGKEGVSILGDESKDAIDHFKDDFTQDNDLSSNDHSGKGKR